MRLAVMWARWARDGSVFLAVQPVMRWAVLALMGWSGLAAAATAGALLIIETAARSAATPPGESVGRLAKRKPATGEAILQRPLFARSRAALGPVVAIQPALSRPSTPALAVRDSGLRLTGVFINSPAAKAFLTSTEKPLGAWVKPDEMFGGWKLIAVRPNEVEVEAAGERLVVAYSAARAPTEPPRNLLNGPPAIGAGAHGMMPLTVGRTANDPRGLVQNVLPHPPFPR